MLRRIFTVTSFGASRRRPEGAPSFVAASSSKLARRGLQQYRQIKTNSANKNALGARIVAASSETATSAPESAATTTTASTASSRASQTNIELDDIELDLGDQSKLTFNLTWLRDSCHCNACTHQYSRQRLFTPKDFKRRNFLPETLKISAGDGTAAGRQVCGPRADRAPGPSSNSVLELKWADGHQSVYSLDWLRKIGSLYAERKLSVGASGNNSLALAAKFELPADDFYAPVQAKQAPQVHWTAAKIGASLQPVDYHDLTHGFDFSQFDHPTFINANRIGDMSERRARAVRSLCSQLVAFGLAKLSGVPKEPGQVLKVARSLAYERPTGYGTLFDVVVEPSEQINLAYSAQEFDLHSDLTYRETSPGVQLLHCISNSTSGGLSYFCDAFNAAHKLRQLDEKLFEVLLKFPAIFVVRDPYRDIKFRRQQPILALDFQNNLSEVHYSPFMLPPLGHKDDVKLFYLAMDKFTQLLQSSDNKLISKMEPGDLFVFHNRRVLHGRSSYDPASSKRFLQGCYMDWDEIKCLHEKLQSAAS